MNYTRKNFEEDLKNPKFIHLENKERFKNFYEELGKEGATINQDFSKLRMDFIVPKGKIIELGCGWGVNIIYWARQGFNCVGVEISENAIKLGKEKLSLESPETQKRVIFINSFIENYPITEKFDTVVLTETLEHVIDPLSVLRKAEECLAPDGLLYITVPSERFGNASHVRGIDKVNMIKLLSQTNLNYISWKENTFWLMTDGRRIYLTMCIVKK